MFFHCLSELFTASIFQRIADVLMGGSKSVRGGFFLVFRRMVENRCQHFAEFICDAVAADGEQFAVKKPLIFI